MESTLRGELRLDHIRIGARQSAPRRGIDGTPKSTTARSPRSLLVVVGSFEARGLVETQECVAFGRSPAPASERTPGQSGAFTAWSTWSTWSRLCCAKLNCWRHG